MVLVVEIKLNPADSQQDQMDAIPTSPTALGKRTIDEFDANNTTEDSKRVRVSDPTSPIANAAGIAVI
jgi:hypothetical protein